MKVITKDGLFEYDSLEIITYFEGDSGPKTEYEVRFYDSLRHRTLNSKLYRSKKEAQQFILRVAAVSDRPYFADNEMMELDPYE